ncbi:rna-directed dna polymerase from mobile element hypothetical protein [Limosa lapponica baueri]|uniref:Uncharacterized protein n=1 Tax=Limosa lapponica baueri TaxID=1758121 RepID=A0A2I0TW97_LIMLA|nr:rna-directed dna polymerase from mobile element hypothetical protein [Limosa lapponica baueri]
MEQGHTFDGIEGRLFHLSEITVTEHGLNYVSWKDWSDNPTVVYFPDNSKDDNANNLKRGLCYCESMGTPTTSPHSREIPGRPETQVTYIMEGDQLLPEDWSKPNVTPVFKKGKKEDPGNYRLVSLASLPGKMMDGMSHSGHHLKAYGGKESYQK